MLKTIDLTGQKFERLTVLYQVDKRSDHGDIMWMCECSCGKNVLVAASSLRANRIKSCGCLKEEQKERVRKMGLSTRKHYGCMVCGLDKHYAKGYCESCYRKKLRGTL